MVTEDSSPENATGACRGMWGEDGDGTRPIKLNTGQSFGMTDVKINLLYTTSYGCYNDHLLILFASACVTIPCDYFTGGVLLACGRFPVEGGASQGNPVPGEAPCARCCKSVGGKPRREESRARVLLRFAFRE